MEEDMMKMEAMCVQYFVTNQTIVPAADNHTEGHV